jgi:dUTP pyrophosphatase
MSLKGHVLAGVIDSGYTGEVKIVMYCHSSSPIVIRRGDKVAQMVIVNNLNAKFTIEEANELSLTDRGSGGFGSTGG